MPVSTWLQARTFAGSSVKAQARWEARHHLSGLGRGCLNREAVEGFATDTQAGLRATLAEMRRQLSAIQNAQNDELVKTCPSMFVLAPAAGFELLDTYLEYATQKDELDLMLYCEWEKEWHTTQHSVYRFRPEQEWFVSLKEKWSELVKVTKRVAPLAGFGASLLGTPAVGIAVRKLAEEAEKIAGGNEKVPAGELAAELGLRERTGLISLEARHLLARLIKYLDSTRAATQPALGGLHPYHLKEDGRLLWLCAEHRAQYDSANRLSER